MKEYDGTKSNADHARPQVPELLSPEHRKSEAFSMPTFLALIAGLTLIPSLLVPLAFSRPRRLTLRDFITNWAVAFLSFLVSWMIMITATGFKGHTNVFIILAFVASVASLILFNSWMLRRKRQAHQQDDRSTGQ